MSEDTPALEERTVSIEVNGQTYEALFERGERNWSASVVVEGIAVATGKTFDETLTTMRQALQFHLDGLTPARQGKVQPISRRKRHTA